MTVLHFSLMVVLFISIYSLIGLAYLPLSSSVYLIHKFRQRKPKLQELLNKLYVYEDMLIKSRALPPELDDMLLSKESISSQCVRCLSAMQWSIKDNQLDQGALVQAHCANFALSDYIDAVKELEPTKRDRQERLEQPFILWPFVVCIDIVNIIIAYIVTPVFTSIKDFNNNMLRSQLRLTPQRKDKANQ